MRKANSAYGFFGRLVGFIGVTCIIASWWTGSVVPLIIGAVVLVCTLNFMNGIGEKQAKPQQAGA